MIKLSKEAYQVLQEIIENEDTPDYWEKRCTNLKKREESALRGCFSELKKADMISVRWADGYPYFIQVHKNGYFYDTYVKEKKRASMSQFEIEFSELLERGKNIKKLINDKTASSNTYTIELHIAEWENDAEIFYNKYLKKHVLGKKMNSIIYLFTPDEHDFLKLFSCLCSVARDRDFVDELRGIQ